MLDCQVAPIQRLVNQIGMKFALIPAGEFSMGTDETAEQRQADFPQYDLSRLETLDERPAHLVRITKPFYFGIHAVTRGEFRKFVELSGRLSEAETDGTGGYGFEPGRPLGGDAFAGRDPIYTWRDPGFLQEDNHPVVNVTWNDAVAMCEWLSQQEHATFRLPTEAEWEYACRAGTTTRYSSGNHPLSLKTLANQYDQAKTADFPHWEKYAQPYNNGFRFTAPVGSFAPNAFGLYDMHGNVWEWCSDWYDEGYYAVSPVEDPLGPPPSDDFDVKVRRGGSWHSWAYYTRSTYRNYNDCDSRYTLLGFRIVREV